MEKIQRITLMGDRKHLDKGPPTIPFPPRRSPCIQLCSNNEQYQIMRCEIYWLGRSWARRSARRWWRPKRRAPRRVCPGGDVAPAHRPKTDRRTYELARRDVKTFGRGPTPAYLGAPTMRETTKDKKSVFCVSSSYLGSNRNAPLSFGRRIFVKILPPSPDETVRRVID